MSPRYESCLLSWIRTASKAADLPLINLLCCVTAVPAPAPPSDPEATRAAWILAFCSLMAASSSLILICCFTNSAPVDKWLHHHHNSNSTSREQNNQQGCCYFSHLSHLSTLPNSHLQNGVVRDQSVTSYCNTVTLFRAVHFTRSTLIRKRIQFITDPMYIIIVELSEFSLCRLRCCALF